MVEIQPQRTEPSPLDPIKVEFRDEYLWVTLRDQRVIGYPISAFSWLQNATPEQREDYELLDETILWDSLDEALDTEEMLVGFGYPAR